MARKSTKGTRQLGVEVAETLIEEVRAFAVARGEKLRQVVEEALRRHMAYPPPPVPPVPPPVPAPLPDAAGKKSAARPKGKK